MPTWSAAKVHPDHHVQVSGWGAYASYRYPGGMAIRKLVGAPLAVK